MSSFSVRMGLKKARSIAQVGSMDEPLKDGLWNSFVVCCLSKYKLGAASQDPDGRTVYALVEWIWTEYLKMPHDTMPRWFFERTDDLRKHFYECKWNQTYDFIEFTAQALNSMRSDLRVSFVQECNRVMERELSGYRFAGDTIVPVTDPVELDEVGDALGSPVQAARDHIRRATELLGNRERPDYRNSVKESISGVEAICRVIAQNDKATLGDALKAIERCGQLGIHPAMRNAFSSLYGYTNDQRGIRHSLLDGDDVNANDARFMLVACSAFINLLVAKASLRR